MKPYAIPSFCLVVVLSTAANLAIAARPAVGTLEVVAELDINPGNVSVTPEGRIFATVHQFRRGPVQLIEILDRTTYQPWPSADWNGVFGSGPNVFNSLLGIQIDAQNRLWVIDNGLGEPEQTPKLMAFNVDSGSVVFRYDFPSNTGPKGSFLQDIAVDEDHGFVYIADVGGAHEPAIVVVDIGKNTSRRFSGHPSLSPENVDLEVEDKVITIADAEGQQKPARIGINPITISADKEMLFYGAMNGTNWYRVPARLFREGADDASIAAAVMKAGPKPVSDGASTDAEGNHYFTNVGRNAIDVLKPGGTLHHLVQDDRVIWPDALSFGPESWLYIAVNQLNRAPAFNDGREMGGPPFMIMRVWTGTRGIPGR